MNSGTDKKPGIGGLTEQDLTTIIEVLEQHTLVDQALLFGSRAKGNYKNGSDVDIALKGRHLDFKAITRISYLLNEETKLPYRFDVLDYYKTNEAIAAHIDRVGIVFYERKENY